MLWIEEMRWFEKEPRPGHWESTNICPQDFGKALDDCYKLIADGCPPPVLLILKSGQRVFHLYVTNNNANGIGELYESATRPSSKGAGSPQGEGGGG